MIQAEHAKAWTARADKFLQIAERLDGMGSTVQVLAGSPFSRKNADAFPRAFPDKADARRSSRNEKACRSGAPATAPARLTRDENATVDQPISAGFGRFVRVSSQLSFYGGRRMTVACHFFLHRQPDSGNTI